MPVVRSEFVQLCMSIERASKDMLTAAQSGDWDTMLMYARILIFLQQELQECVRTKMPRNQGAELRLVALAQTYTKNIQDSFELLPHNIRPPSFKLPEQPKTVN